MTRNAFIRNALALALFLPISSFALAQTDSVRQTRFLNVWADHIWDRSAFVYATIAYPAPTSVGWFEWGDSGTYGHTTPRFNFRWDIGNGMITYQLTDLTPDDTIHARAILENPAGRVVSQDFKIRTLSRRSFGGAVITSVTAVTSRSAFIRAEFELEKSGTMNYSFVSGRSLWTLHSSPLRTESFQAGRVSVSGKLTGLIPATPYVVRLVVSNPEGVLHSSPADFSTLADSVEHGFVIPISLASGTGSFQVRHWGVHTLASNCTDDDFDEMSLPPGPPEPIFEPRFTYYRPDVRSCYDLGTYMDVRKYTLPTQIDTYKLRFPTVSEDYPIRISWPSLDAYYAGDVKMFARPDTIDMKRQSSYLITNENIATVMIYASAPTEIGKLSRQSESAPPSPKPVTYAVEQNYPNPFNPTTVIRYTLAEQTRVTIVIYNLLGQAIAKPLDAVQDAGNRSIVWDATNFPAGIYFYTIRAGNFTEVRKMLVIK